MIRSNGIHRPLRATIATIALALGLAAPAAHAQMPPNNGGIDQYVAPVPDSRGDRPANPGHQGSGPSQLPPRVRGSLPAGSEGTILARLATDPGSGAPVDGTDRGDGTRSGGAAGGGSGGGGSDGGGGDSAGGANSPTTTATKEKQVSAASAITSSISNDPAVAVVVAALLGLTLALGAIGLARRRRGS
jgi:hypothetical protein